MAISSSSKIIVPKPTPYPKTGTTGVETNPQTGGGTPSNP